MPDAKVRNEPSIVEARKKARRASKWLKAASRANKITKGKAAKKNKRDWLKAPPVIRKIKSTIPLKKMKRAGVRVAPAAVSMAPFKSAGAIAPVAGVWNGIELIPVISSNVAAIGYNVEEATLIVAFLDGGIYEYYSVDSSVWQLFQVTPSKGKFVWTHLRDKYAYQRVA